MNQNNTMLIMNEDFVPYELAVKLKEKGFTCEYPFGMYNKYEQFCPLYSSDKYYFRIDDFAKHDYIAPTISQVLKWLREEKKIHIGFGYSPRKKWRYVVMYMDDRFYNKPTLAVDGFIKIEIATLAGIEYVIDNLI